ncbi:MAG: SIMPL domain-containing protein [Selenomonadaceae bacterium]|nr:SIMPL domain-containing protein [Selenomonadaceae bacterium]
MRKFFTLTMMLLMICTTAFAEEVKPPIIAVSGEGSVEVEPNRATISVGVNTKAKDTSTVQNANAKAAASVINSIVALGIDRRNISTGKYNFSPVYRNKDDGRREIDGYEANNSVTVIVDDLSLIGKVIDTALAHGATNVNSLNFDLRDKETYQDKALRLAVLDAKRKAEIAAAALGKNIVGVYHVLITSASVNAPYSNKLMRSMEDSTATPIESGTLECSAEVHVEFEISK